MRILLLPLAPLLIASAGVDEANSGDAQCLLAMGRVAASDHPATRSTALAAVQYYLGRIDGRTPDVDLAALLKKAAESMKPEDLQPTLQRCGPLFQQRGRMLEAIGQSLAKEPTGK
ncbi:MAG TPA: hypothetical protein VGW34_16050 [Allosphingosinicella sp.]|nr:hypothetical protein [Allosphingosinicella sp.]